MSQITTHVLDISIGRPAADVPVVLEIEKSPGEWKELGRGATDGNGRLGDLMVPGSLKEGAYRLTFDTRVYFGGRKMEALYPQVSIVFEVRRANEHHHIPLLLSPFGYSTYRGS
ncbi:MAG: hydroxyisourate hydrolase [Candidatus Acidiferrales bacterium]